MSTREYVGVCISISFHKVSSAEAESNNTPLFTISKKQIKGAVERNKIKRWVREAWRSTPLARDKRIQVRIKVKKGLNECSYMRTQGDVEGGVAFFLSNKR